MRNILNMELKGYPVIGVMEFSTRAVKLLIGNTDKLIDEGFSFDNFYRRSILTDTGEGIDKNGFMDIDYFMRKTVAAAKQLLLRARQNNVNILFCIATSPFRASKNQRELLEILKDECNLDVKVLTVEEEAKASIKAFLFAFGESYPLTKKPILLIDEGSGSIEVAVLEDGNITYARSIEISTSVFKNKFIDSMDTYGQDIKKSFEKNVDQEIDDILSKFIENDAPVNKEYSCIAMGSAINEATNKSRCKNQHGIVINSHEIEEKMEWCEQLIKQEYIQYGTIITMEDVIMTRIGLYIFQKIMDHFKLDSVMVNGAGLWYGVYAWQAPSNLGIRGM